MCRSFLLFLSLFSGAAWAQDPDWIPGPVDLPVAAPGNAIPVETTLNASDPAGDNGRSRGTVVTYNIPTDRYPDQLIFSTVRGADGGTAQAGGPNNRDRVKAIGGGGALLEARFAIRPTGEALRPGGQLRMVVGNKGGLAQGGSALGVARRRGSGGGGGTGVLYKGPEPGADWEPLMVAGGGAGAFVNFTGGDIRNGGNASVEINGRNGGSRDGQAGGIGGLNGRGGESISSGGAGGGGWAGGSTTGGEKGSPAGGVGSGSRGAGSNGGYGVGGGGGGGGTNNTFSFGVGGGGGGGYSGGGAGAGTSGGGGGSFISSLGTNQVLTARNGAESNGVIVFTHSTDYEALNVPPVITMNGSNPVVVGLNTTFTDPGASAADLYGNVLTPQVVSNSVNTSVVGTYAVVYEVTDQFGQTAQMTRTVEVANLPPSTPQFLISNNPLVLSDSTLKSESPTDRVVGRIVSTDPEGDALTYGLILNPDARLMRIDPVTGVLSFQSPPDFENPSDSGFDNIYNPIVTVSNGTTTVSNTVSVEVVDELEFIIADPAADWVPSDGTTAGSVTGGTAEGWSYFRADQPSGGNRVPLVQAIATGGRGGPGFAGHPTNGLPAIQGDNANRGQYELFADGDLNRPQLGVDLLLCPGEFGTTPTDDGYAEYLIARYTLTADDLAGVSTVDILGSFRNRATGFNSIEAGVYHNGTRIWPQDGLAQGNDANGLDGDTRTLDFADGAFDLAGVSVLAGDTIEFVVGSNGDSGGDETALKATIRRQFIEPTFLTLDSSEVVENTSVVGTVSSDGDTADYRLVGGDDRGLFTLDPVTGVLSFLTAPDFENPSDQDFNNVYEVVIGKRNLAQSFQITVINGLSDDPPSIPVLPTTAITENSTLVGTVTSIQPAGLPVTYALAGGDDQAFFTIDPISGELSFLEAPDFEMPGDFVRDNVYEVIVQASASGGNSAATFLIEVTDLDEAPTTPILNNRNVTETNTVVGTVTTTDPSGGRVTFILVGGNDQALFTINPDSGLLRFLVAPDFEAPSDSDQDNVYEVTVQAGAIGGETSETFQIRVINQEEPPSTPVLDNRAVAEGQTLVGTVTSVDPAGGSVSYALLDTPDSGQFTIDPVSGVLSFVTPPDFETPADSNGNNVYEVGVLAIGDGNEPALFSIRVFDLFELPAGVSPVEIGIFDNFTAGGANFPLSATSSNGGEAFDLESNLDVSRIRPGLRQTEIVLEGGAGPVTANFVENSGDRELVFNIPSDSEAGIVVAYPGNTSPSATLDLTASGADALWVTVEGIPALGVIVETPEGTWLSIQPAIDGKVLFPYAPAAYIGDAGGPDFTRISNIEFFLIGSDRGQDIGEGTYRILDIHLADLVGPPYALWALASGLFVGVNDSPADDPNADGKPNILHFAHDTDPLGDGSNEGKVHLGIFAGNNGVVLEEGDFAALDRGGEKVIKDFQNYMTMILPVRVGAEFTRPLLVTPDLIGGEGLTATVDGVKYTIQGTLDLVSWNQSVVESTTIPFGEEGGGDGLALEPEIAIAFPAVPLPDLPPLRDIDGDGEPDWEYRSFQLLSPFDSNDRGFLRSGVEFAQ